MHTMWRHGTWVTHGRFKRRPSGAGGTCPLEEVQDEAFQEVARVVAAPPQSLEAQHGVS